MMKFVFGMQRTRKNVYELSLSFWVCAATHAQSAQNRKFAYLCNISRKTMGMKLLFCLQINTKIFYKVLVSLWMSVSRLSQSIQDIFILGTLGKYAGIPKVPNIFAISQEKWNKWVVFCLQINIKDFFRLMLSFKVWWGMPNLPKITSLLFLCNNLRRKGMMKLICFIHISM